MRFDILADAFSVDRRESSGAVELKTEALIDFKLRSLARTRPVTVEDEAPD